MAWRLCEEMRRATAGNAKALEQREFPRPGQEGLITLRQEVQNGPFTKGPAVPDLP
jgi:hypothetical protein